MALIAFSKCRMLIWKVGFVWDTVQRFYFTFDAFYTGDYIIFCYYSHHVLIQKNSRIC